MKRPFVFTRLLWGKIDTSYRYLSLNKICPLVMSSRGCTGYPPGAANNDDGQG